MIFYKVIDDDQYYELSPKCDVNVNPSWVAEEVAQDFFENHNGWEADWPLTFALYNEEEGKEICIYKVELSQEPVFSTQQIVI